MDRNMALRQYRDPGHAVRLEVVHVDMQQGRLRGVHTTPQGRLDQIDVVEAFGPVQIDNEMDPGTTHAVTNGEVVLAIFGRRRLHDRNVSDILSGGGWIFRALPRSQEGVLAHCRPPQPSGPIPNTGERRQASECRSTSPRTDRSQRLVPT